MRSVYCCSLRTCVLAVGIVFLACQTSLLVLNFLLMNDVERHVETAFEWFEEGVDSGAGDGEEMIGSALKEQVIRRASDFLAIPITLNIVLMIADSLLIWAVVSQHRILLWPWLVLYAVEFFVFIALLIYFMVIMPKTYMKVILFLVVCPFLVVFFFCWFVVKCFYNYLRDLNLKEAVAAVYAQSQQKSLSSTSNPPTVYPCGDQQQNWDQPLPIWASGHPTQQTVWDPSYLQKMDPRYGGGSGATSSAAGGGGVMSTSYYAKSSASSNKRNKVSPTMLPDGTLVVPISDDVDHSDDEEELSGIVEVEEEDDEDEDDYERSKHNSTGGGHPPSTTTVSAAPSDRVYRYQVRPVAAARTFASSKPNSDAGSIALSDKYRRVQQARSKRSDDQSSIAMSLSDKYRVQEEIEVEPEEVYQTMPPAPKPILPPPPPVRFGDSPRTLSTSPGSSRH